MKVRGEQAKRPQPRDRGCKEEAGGLAQAHGNSYVRKKERRSGRGGRGSPQPQTFPPAKPSPRLVLHSQSLSLESEVAQSLPEAPRKWVWLGTGKGT